METARAGRETWLSGRDVGDVPFRIEGTLGRLLVPFVFRVLFHRVLTVDTPIGRKMRPKAVSQGGPLIRVKPKDLASVGVRRVGPVSGIRDGLPVLEGGPPVRPANVVWCTGYHPGLSWIDPAGVRAGGEPVQERGVAASEPGLYFVGLHFLYALSSRVIHGVERDARRVAETIARRTGAGTPQRPTVEIRRRVKGTRRSNPPPHSYRGIARSARRRPGRPSAGHPFESEQKANAWYEEQPWLVGSNFVPQSAINQLEMWQEATFDPVEIDRELGWAEAMGMNTMRVFLHDLLWQQDSTSLLEAHRPLPGHRVPAPYPADVRAVRFRLGPLPN